MKKSQNFWSALYFWPRIVSNSVHKKKKRGGGGKNELLLSIKTGYTVFADNS